MKSCKHCVHYTVDHLYYEVCLNYIYTVQLARSDETMCGKDARDYKPTLWTKIKMFFRGIDTL